MRRLHPIPVSRAALATLVALFVAASACGEPATSSGSSPSESYSGTWVLVQGHGSNGDIPLVKGYRITLEIDGDQAGGTAACNTYGGALDIEGDSFAFTGGSMTEMACDDPAMEAEAAYMAALPELNRISRQGDTLTLSGSKAELSFELQPPPPTAQLIDTVWQLDTLIQGAGADGSAASAAPGELIMHSDGTLSGSTGCRQLHGKWIERGDEILFTEFGAEGHCPEELRDQDGHVVGVLGDGFTAEIDGQRLLVYGHFGEGELGLGYTAEPND